MTSTAQCIDHNVGGETITEVILENKSGARASILSFGAVLRDLQVPLKDGSVRRVVLGFEKLESYIENGPYLGTVVGRVCNRIDKGAFTLDGKSYQLPVNGDGNVHLHGGVKGFTRRNWTVESATVSSVKLGITSPDGEEGYPGKVEVSCLYELTEDNGLCLTINGQCDSPTLLNMTNHSYFNLASDAGAADHWLEINADLITPAHSNQIPTGEILSVKNTAFDFRSLRKVGQDYEVNFAVNGPREEKARVARLQSPEKDLEMEVWSNQPGLLFYTAAGLPEIVGIDGQKIGVSRGLCLETAGFADAINNRYFPSPILRPGQIYEHICEYRFNAL
nr:aldose epimerase family protein [uncultured Cohaesibacter sp.]